MVDRVKATELRKQGKTYKEIAEECNCSVVWCKKSLKDVIVVKDLSNNQLLSTVIDLLKEVEERSKNG